MKSKPQVRQAMREALRLTTTDRNSEAAAVFAAIEREPWFAAARTILLYYSMPSELPTHDVVERWSLSKTVYLPRVAGDTLELVRYTGALSRDNRYHIAEPVGPTEDISHVDLAIVPGLAFDRQGNRLGRGGGYYDRLLATLRCGIIVGVGLACQLIDQVPTAPHDHPLDAVFTSKEHIIINA